MDKTKLNWIAFLIGKVTEAELMPANRRRLEAQRQARKETIEAGEVPLKPKALQGFDGQWYVAVLPKGAYGDD